MKKSLRKWLIRKLGGIADPFDIPPKIVVQHTDPPVILSAKYVYETTPPYESDVLKSMAKDTLSYQLARSILSKNLIKFEEYSEKPGRVIIEAKISVVPPLKEVIDAASETK